MGELFGEEIESWVHDGFTNIISIPVMKKLGFPILYSSDDFVVVVTQGDITVIFCKDKQGLPYIGLQDKEHGVVFVQKLCAKASNATPNTKSRKLLLRARP